MMRELQLLVVEDDSDHYRLMEKALEGSGVTHLRRFVRGEELLSFLDGCALDESMYGATFCILLDLGLPGLSGIEVLGRLKAKSNWARIPVIVLTSSTNPDVIARCHQMGCSHFVAKPIVSEDFQRAMSQLGLFVNLVELPSPFRKV